MTQHFRPMDWIGHRAVAKAQSHSVRAVRVAVFHDLASIEPLWQQIAQSSDCSVFQDLAVFKAWVLHIATLSPVDWFVAVLIDVQTGAPLMLLPLVLRREGSLRVIEGADLGVADFVGPVTARGFAPTRSEMLVYWEQLKAALPPADVLRLSKMPARIGRTRNPLLLLCNVNRTKLSNFKTDLDADFDGWYGANVPQKIRDDLKVRRRKLD